MSYLSLPVRLSPLWKGTWERSHWKLCTFCLVDWNLKDFVIVAFQLVSTARPLSSRLYSQRRSMKWHKVVYWTPFFSFEVVLYLLTSKSYKEGTGDTPWGNDRQDNWRYRRWVPSCRNITHLGRVGFDGDEGRGGPYTRELPSEEVWSSYTWDGLHSFSRSSRRSS